MCAGHFPLLSLNKGLFIDHGLLVIPPEHLYSPDCSHFTLCSPFFSNFSQVSIEYCSGNGEWICKKAAKNPEECWVAVEKSWKRAQKIHKRKMALNLSNVLVVQGDGLLFSSNFLLDSTINNVYVNFPDPWPKKKHQHRRLIQKKFAAELLRILKKNGSIAFVTDHLLYFKQIEFVMDGWKAIHKDVTDYGTSFFERLFRKEHRSIYYQFYEKY